MPKSGEALGLIKMIEGITKGFAEGLRDKRQFDIEERKLGLLEARRKDAKILKDEKVKYYEAEEKRKQREHEVMYGKEGKLGLKQKEYFRKKAIDDIKIEDEQLSKMRLIKDNNININKLNTGIEKSLETHELELSQDKNRQNEIPRYLKLKKEFKELVLKADKNEKDKLDAIKESLTYEFKIPPETLNKVQESWEQIDYTKKINEKLHIDHGNLEQLKSGQMKEYQSSVKDIIMKEQTVNYETRASDIERMMTINYNTPEGKLEVSRILRNYPMEVREKLAAPILAQANYQKSEALLKQRVIKEKEELKWAKKGVEKPPIPEMGGEYAKEKLKRSSKKLKAYEKQLEETQKLLKKLKGLDVEKYVKED